MNDQDNQSRLPVTVYVGGAGYYCIRDACGNKLAEFFGEDALKDATELADKITGTNLAWSMKSP